MKQLIILALISSFLKSPNEIKTKTIDVKQVSIKTNSKLSLLGDKLMVDLPEGFELMGSEMLAAKYPSGNRPTVVYTNKEGTINFAFNHTQNPLPIDKLSQVLPAFVGQFGTLFPGIKWYKKEIQKINGQEYISLEFLTSAVDSKIYNIMHITSLNGRMLFCTFNCLESQKAEWQSKARVALNSVELKE